jgi:DNA-binding LacI/PurR family transcriptional regulator
MRRCVRGWSGVDENEVLGHNVYNRLYKEEIGMSNTNRKSVTLREVAALAGIDKATASRALNGKGYVSPQTRDAALKAAQALGFEPDLNAQRLAEGRNHKVIGLLPPRDLGVLTQQAYFIEHRLDELDFEVQTYNVPRWVSHFEERQIALVNKVRRQRPGAIIVGSPFVPGVVPELRLFRNEGGIVVSYGTEIDLDCDQVPFDSEHRAYTAARHLLELGHQKIGFCFHGPVPQNRNESDQLAGFSRALEEFGASVQVKWLFAGGDYEEGGARLAEAFLTWPEKPTALCIVNDVSASTFVTALARNGRKVPDDVSVVGFDDAPAARYALVPLTTVSYPLDTIGRHVVEFTHSRLQGYDGPPRKLVVQSELIIRNSSAPLQLARRDSSRRSSSDQETGSGFF